jgi:uncharacterized protein (TIGR03435 family)
MRRLAGALGETARRAGNDDALARGNTVTDGTFPRAPEIGIVNVPSATVFTCAAGVAGGELKRRIEGIMMNRLVRELMFGRKLLLTLAAMVAVAAPFAIGLLSPTRSRAQPQTETALPKFEVASVKPAAPQPAGYGTLMRVDGGPGTADPGQLQWTNVTLAFVLKRAYGRKDYEIVAPKWLDSARYDLVAKVPQGATKKDLMPMLQNLLVERFQLAIHHEQKELPVFALVVSKNGPKMREAASDPDSSRTSGVSHASPTPQFPPDGFPKLPAGMTEGSAALGTAEGSLRMTYKGQTTTDLVENLLNFVPRPVMDGTGLKAKYDFTLEFTPETMRRAGALGPTTVDAPDTQNGLTIFEAVESQLGLKLEPSKAPVDILVVDHVERTPTEN